MYCAVVFLVSHVHRSPVAEAHEKALAEAR
jgi:hypothetical protein